VCANGEDVQGCRLIPGAFWLLAVAVCAGCVDDPPDPPVPPADPPPAAGSAFDPATAGTVAGRVTWSGPVPAVPPLDGWVDLAPDGPGARHIIQDNPNAPAVGPDGGVARAVVFLRGVDVRRGRPWDHAPVRVVQRDYRFHVRQGDADGRDGFVRRGDALEMVAGDPVFYALHAGGAAFFSLTFPDPGVPRRRVLDRTGLVELTSTAGYPWMRAYLFVDEHPYHAHTDAAGRFALPQVPPGEYEVVCWLPNWREASHDRDPETSLVTRLHFRPPVERAQQVRLGPRETREVTFTLSGEDF
jgi:hypothetical protein